MVLASRRKEALDGPGSHPQQNAVNPGSDQKEAVQSGFRRL